jgi:hypothetical protein
VHLRQSPQLDDRRIANRLSNRRKDTAASGPVGRLGPRGARPLRDRHGGLFNRRIKQAPRMQEAQALHQ